MVYVGFSLFKASLLLQPAIGDLRCRFVFGFCSGLSKTQFCPFEPLCSGLLKCQECCPIVRYIFSSASAFDRLLHSSEVFSAILWTFFDPN